MRRQLSPALAAVALLNAVGRCAAAAAAGHTGTPNGPTPVLVQATRHGFNWGDAAIGAAAALGLVLALTGALILRTGGTSS